LLVTKMATLLVDIISFLLLTCVYSTVPPPENVLDLNGIDAKIDIQAAYGNRPGSATDTHSCGHVRGLPSILRSRTHMYPSGLTAFYQKYTEAYGIPVVSSSRVSDSALQRACYVLRFMLADRYDVRNAFYKSSGRVALIATSEGTTSIPEHSYLPNWWNQRARGLGATRARPVSSAGEENALCLRNDRYPDQDIVLHEYVHAVHNIGATIAIRGFHSRLTTLYNSAKARGLWRNTYSMSTVEEYWAEGVQSYFNVNRHNNVPDGIQGPISNRPALRGYDPGLYNIIREVFPCDNEYIKRCRKSRSLEANQELRQNCIGGGGVGGTTTTVEPPVTTTAPGGSTCVDNNAHCPSWAQNGECSSNPGYMLVNCKRSCNSCGGTCVDNDANCQSWARNGECQSNPGYMLVNCKLSCNSCGSSNCIDANMNCSSWSRAGECQRNPGYMHQSCRKSCNIC
ncbi:unnamed protein product, partial [Owenia fusiformis]